MRGCHHKVEGNIQIVRNHHHKYEDAIIIREHSNIAQSKRGVSPTDWPKSVSAGVFHPFAWDISQISDRSKIHFGWSISSFCLGYFPNFRLIQNPFRLEYIILLPGIFPKFQIDSPVSILWSYSVLPASATGLCLLFRQFSFYLW